MGRNKVTHVKSDPAHEAKWGGYNSAPPNFQLCPSDEFCYADREFRQFVIPTTPSPEPVRIITGTTPYVLGSPVLRRR